MIESIINFIPNVIGLGVIDENLTNLLAQMENMSPQLHLPDLMGMAKTIGLGIALGVGANECYQMILGKRGIDVMKLLHIIIISLCISFAGSIANIAKQPGMMMENLARSSAFSMNEEIEKKEKEVASCQEDYIDKVRQAMHQLEEQQKAESKVEDSPWYEKLDKKWEETKLEVTNTVKEYMLIAETKICEWISLIIRLIGEVLLQAIMYGLLVSQRIFMHLLEMVAPLMFAISLSPHFKSAWSQWLSKYISISLWGFVTYVCMFYIFFIIDYNLSQDIAAYDTLLGKMKGDNVQIGAIGMQAVGSTCMYVVGMLVGVKVLSLVPEVASWLIPGGVSSSAGTSAGGFVERTAMSVAKKI